MGWWAERRARKARRARFERFVDQVPVGMTLLCGRVVGVDVPQAEVRRHLEKDCTPREPGGLCCVELVQR